MASSLTLEARFISGNPVYIDHTPSSAIAAGEVVTLGNRPYVAHEAIAANTKGALAAGGGVYDLVKDDTSGPAITQGEEVYWLSGSNLATDDPEDAVHFGPAVDAADGSTSPVRVLHSPNGAAIVDLLT